MPSTQSNHNTLWRRFELLLFILLLFFIALRTTHTETIQKAMSSSLGLLSSSAWSMVISASIILIMIVWLALSFSQRNISYKKSGIEFGAILFLMAAAASTFYASDKRAAINDTVTIASALSAAVVLTQFLSSQRRIKLLLMVIAATAVVNCYQSSEQFFSSNQMMIDQYEENPEIQLEQMNIEPGSFQQSAYEHRLYSRDVRGFFTTGNSAASYALLALAAAAAMFTSEIRNPDKDGMRERNLIIYAGLIVVIIFSLILTHSKGGIAGSAAAAVLFTAYLMLRKLPKAVTKTLIIAVIVLAIGAAAAVILYGIKHDNLPGGNSMLVRWQYWKGAASVYAENKLTGVGGGNFGAAYTKYKTPAAPETVKDPHCFPLSILVQYGVFGMIGFLLAMAVPILKIIFANELTCEQIKPLAENENEFKCGAIAGTAVTIGLLIFRPIFMSEFIGRNIGEKLFVFFYIYLPPVIMFGVSFLFMWIAARRRPRCQLLFGNTEIALIICCLAGVAAHNMIDFAIFEPGILTVFFAMIACIIAMQTDAHPKPSPISRPKAIVGASLCTAAALILFKIALIPMLRADMLIQKAMLDLDYNNAHILLAKAANADPLSPEPADINGRMYLQQFMQSTGEDTLLLENSVKMQEFAALHDQKNFKHYEKLAETYRLWAKILASSDITASREKLTKAYDNVKIALGLYPGSGDLWYELAEICEKLQLNDESIQAYSNAAEIEEAYQQQFRLMYPGREMVSRLGDYKYQLAKEKSAKTGR